MSTLKEVMDKGEKVLWRGKPKFWPFVFGSLVASLFGLVLLSIPVFIFLTTGDLIAIMLPHFWVGLIVFIGPLAYAVLVHKHVDYAITGKRVIVKKGLIGRDFDTIDFEKMQDISVNVGVIDKIFGTGSIISSSAGRMRYSRRGSYNVPGNIFRAIENPYKVFKLLKKVAMDVKADIHFPTAYRPKRNVGYNTRYDPAGKAKRRLARR